MVSSARSTSPAHGIPTGAKRMPKDAAASILAIRVTARRSTMLSV
ncbi:MAG TPA: hypothetical protein VIY50_00070 [Steroidobacteraceae bacterium]